MEDGTNPGRESAVYCKCPVMKCLMSNSENRGRSPPSGCLGSGFSKTPCTGWTCGVGDRDRAVTAGEIVPHVFPQVSVLLTIRTGNDIGNDLIQSLSKCIDYDTLNLWCFVLGLILSGDKELITCPLDNSS